MNIFTALLKGYLSRSKGILLTAMVCSIGIALMVVSAFNTAEVGPDTIKLGFIDNDKSAVSIGFAKYLTDELGIELVTVGDVDAMNTRLVEKQISGLVEVPAGFEAALFADTHKQVQLTFMDDYANEAFTKGYIDSYTQSLGALLVAAEGEPAKLDPLMGQMEENRVFVTTTEKDVAAVKAQADRDSYQLMISFLLMFSFMMSICLALTLHSDKMAGTYRRVKAGRVTSLEYVSSVAVIGGVLMLLIILPSLIIYALTGSDPGVPILATAGAFAAYSFFVIAFGILIGLVMPGQGGIIAVIIAATTITSLLGGAWFPTSMAPKFFQALGHITPQHWFYEAVNAWQSGAGSPAGAITIILLAGVLCLVIAGVQFTTNKSLSRI